MADRIRVQYAMLKRRANKKDHGKLLSPQHYHFSRFGGQSSERVNNRIDRGEAAVGDVFFVTFGACLARKMVVQNFLKHGRRQGLLMYCVLSLLVKFLVFLFF